MPVHARPEGIWMTCGLKKGLDDLFGLLPRAGPNGSAEELDRIYPRSRRGLVAKSMEGACTKPTNLWFISQSVSN
jgi:hypothetical protein